MTMRSSFWPDVNAPIKRLVVASYWWLLYWNACSLMASVELGMGVVYETMSSDKTICCEHIHAKVDMANDDTLIH